VLSCSVIGAPQTVRRGLDAFLRRTNADELMLTSMIFDHQARLRSYEIAAEQQSGLAPVSAEQTRAAAT
jgi:alkanesulfonate monooxygenase SsuD/methylene tetrahydromethanopterin reductase-like flavin-dependent oxidoreductase (luciferase family)